ncbi:hypothetical protein Q7P37_010623 [Cladosporium fusiforme]
MEGSALFHIYMAAPHPSNPVHHYSELCSTCAARYQRHQVQRRQSTWSEGSTETHSDNDGTNIEAQLAAEDASLAPPPPYTRRTSPQSLDSSPPTYRDVMSSTPPPGVQTTSIQVTLRYTENLILEDDGWSKVVCPTARKYKAIIRVYESMEWEKFWDCLRKVKPSFTMREGGLKDVRALRRKSKWERVVGTRMIGARIRQTTWEEVRHGICSGQMDKIVIAV